MFCKIGVLKNCAIFVVDYFCWSLFLIRLQAFESVNLLKRDSNTGVFLWILRNFYKHLFLQNTFGNCFWKEKFSSLQSLHKSMFWSARKPFKKDSNDCIINNLWFRVTCIILHNLQNTNLQTFLENSILCNFRIKACSN